MTQPTHKYQPQWQLKLTKSREQLNELSIHIATYHVDELGGTETVAECAIRLLRRYRQARMFIKDLLPDQHPRILAIGEPDND